MPLSNRSGRRRLPGAYELERRHGEAWPDVGASRAAEVPVDDLRRWLVQFDGARLVKIDTEGAEYRILPAMRKWITAYGPHLVRKSSLFFRCC